MTIREIEEIESGLRILSYECDEVLNAKFYGNNLFNLYFLYSGFINRLKRKNWAPDVKRTLSKFPRLTQPGFFVFVPLFFYTGGLFFVESFWAVVVFFIFLTMLFALAFVSIKKKVKRDLISIINLSSELRLHLNRIKRLRRNHEI